YYKPFVSWIWAGCALMALGGMLAASDRRYRVRKSTDADEDSSEIHEEKVAS
ncbi:MAG: cytochrome c-type biogenesis CcmF C-terminal domain-containing protein, partial [Fluviibacter sp.]